MDSSASESGTWKPIVGFPDYEVSDRGEIRSRDRVNSYGRRVRGRLMQQSFNSDGHLKCELRVDGKGVTVKVHRVVLEAFVGPCPPGEECRHLNDVKTDNRWPENLKWGTRSENMYDRTRNGLRGHY